MNDIKIISHINSSVDGRLIADRWTLPFDGRDIEDVLSVYTEIKDGYDYEKALQTLHDDFGMRLILLDGGGTLNGQFLKRRLIDELSLVIYPGIDALSGIPSIYEYKGKEDEYPAYGQSLELMDMRQCRDGVVWLKYKVHKKNNNHE